MSAPFSPVAYKLSIANRLLRMAYTFHEVLIFVRAFPERGDKVVHDLVLEERGERVLSDEVEDLRSVVNSLS
jgi:hypothetical protein